MSSHPLPSPCPFHPHSRIVGVCSSCLTDKLASLSCPASSFTILASSASSTSVIRPDQHPSGVSSPGKQRFSSQQSCQITRLHVAPPRDLFDINLDTFHGRIIDQEGFYSSSISGGIREHLHQVLGSNGRMDGCTRGVVDRGGKKQIRCHEEGFDEEEKAAAAPDASSPEIREVESWEEEIRPAQSDAANSAEQWIRDCETEMARVRRSKSVYRCGSERRKSAGIRTTLRDLFAMDDLARRSEEKRMEGMSDMKPAEGKGASPSSSSGAAEGGGDGEKARRWWKMQRGSSGRKKAEEIVAGRGSWSSGGGSINHEQKQQGRWATDEAAKGMDKEEAEEEERKNGGDGCVEAMENNTSSDDESGGRRLICRPLVCCSSNSSSRAPSSPALHVAAAENDPANRLRRSRSCGAATIFSTAKPHSSFSSSSIAPHSRRQQAEQQGLSRRRQEGSARKAPESQSRNDECNGQVHVGMMMMIPPPPELRHTESQANYKNRPKGLPSKLAEPRPAATNRGSFSSNHQRSIPPPPPPAAAAAAGGHPHHHHHPIPNTIVTTTPSAARFSSSKISPTDHPGSGLLRFYLTPLRSSAKRCHKPSFSTSLLPS